MSESAVHRVIKRLAILWLATGLPGLPSMALADAPSPCDPLLKERSASFTATLELRGGTRASRDVMFPAQSKALVIAAETGIDITLEASSGDRLLGRTATPVYRTGVERLVLHTDRAETISLTAVAKADEGAHGQLVIRVFVIDNPAADDACTQAHWRLAVADGHYAAAQAIATNNHGASQTDAPREYKAAADGYLSAIQGLQSPSALQAYGQHAAAAVLYDWIQDWTSARSWAQAAAKSYRQTGDSYDAARANALEAAAFMELALTYRSVNTGSQGAQRTASALRQARGELAAVAAFHTQRGETFDQALALNNMGLGFYYEGLNDEAIRSYRDALTLFNRLGEARWKAIALQNIALADYELGRIEDAIAQYAHLLQLPTQNTDPIVHAAILNNSALANWLGGNMDVALRQYADALDLERKLQNAREQARSLFGIGSVYETLGDSDRALDFYRQTLSLRSADLDARGRAASLRSTANVLRSQGHAQEALAMHNEALSLASTGAQRAPIRIQQARDLEALGQNDSALRQVNSVIGEKDSGRKVVHAQALLERAKIRISKNELVGAETDLRSAIATFAAADSPVDEFSSWVTLAHAQHQRGAAQQALDSLTHALKLAEEVRLQSASPELRASLLQPLRPAFDLKIALLAERYFASPPKPEAAQSIRTALNALSTAEQARARAFADFERFDVGQSPIFADLLKQRRAIYRELAARHYQLEVRRDRLVDDDERVRGIRSDITALRVRLDETDAQINAEAAHTPMGVVRDKWSLDRRSIPTDTAIVEYWTGDETTIAWVITHDSLQMVNLGLSTKITDAVRAFLASLRGLGSVPIATRLSESAHVYSLIIQPLVRHIANRRTLVFVADGALHYAPFAALSASGGDRPRFLVESHDIAMAPSVRILLDQSAQLRAPTAKGDRMLLVADPVYATDDDRLRSTAPMRNVYVAHTDVRRTVFRDSGGAPLPRLVATAQEAATIASLLRPDQVDRLEGFTATKDRFLAAPLDRYRLIHVASHAITDAQIPGLSALAFSAFDPRGRALDNLVFAADFMTLRLNADLVILSACDTALGKSVSGEGLIGLRYIALARGANAVVASLWEVPDRATAELMSSFYRSFLAGHVSVASALSQAMRSMLSGSRPDPSEWGSFTTTIKGLEGRDN